jgi:DNA-binding MarR family transcriptional regulator
VTPATRPSSEVEPALLASELRIAVGRLVRRLRAEQRFPVSQTSVLGRLEREGAQSCSDLAGAEGMRPQSMAQTVADLEADGLVGRRPDPGDRRRALVELTAAGQARLTAERQLRESWLAQAVSDLSEQERATLRDALELFRRLTQR